MSKLRSLLATVLLGVTGCTHLVRDELRPPLSQAELAGEWIGYDAGGNYFCDLLLVDDGTATLATRYRNGSLKLYTFKSWKLERRALAFVVVSTDPAGASATVSGHSSGAQVELEIRGEGWRVVGQLKRKSEWEADVAVAGTAARATRSR